MPPCPWRPPRFFQHAPEGPLPNVSAVPPGRSVNACIASGGKDGAWRAPDSSGARGELQSIPEDV
eukprot:11304823-Alexandrium_andersonii.AAC.1